MRFYGSAMRFPHVQGGFREMLVCDAAQAVPVPAAMSAAQAAFAEPFAVCLHAVNRAGPLLGRRVLVTGAGPIGALTVIAARRAGALEIVATDVADAPLAAARKVGADQAINVTEKDALTRYGADKGHFDVMFEASGNAAALAGGLGVVRPTGIVVQIGIAGGEMTLPMNLVVAKEIELRGTFRFHEEFALAVALIGGWPGRRHAAADRDRAALGRARRLRARGRPVAGDEGATGVLPDRYNCREFWTAAGNHRGGHSFRLSLP